MIKRRRKFVIIYTIIAVIAVFISVILIAMNSKKTYKASAEEIGTYATDGEYAYSGCIVEKTNDDEESLQLLNATTTNKKTCNSLSSTHGSGREKGYSSNFLSTGCGNYMGYSYTYGSSNIPYYIDDTVSSTLAEKIRTQVELWNETKMYDGTGTIVNLYEVDSMDNVDGRKVIKVCVGTVDSSTAVAQFSPSEQTITLTSSINIDTIIHEFGHVLGLDDIDATNDVSSGTHKVLMGYSRSTTNVNKAIQYQDIQGIAVMNNRHTEHVFNRYVKSGNKYIYFCYYCDMVESGSSVTSGTYSMVSAASCTHDYGVIVSAGERYWLKCTKCYKVEQTTTPSLTSLFNGGSGTASDPFLVNSEAQFRNIGLAYQDVYVPREGTQKQITYAFKLTNNITISGVWTPFEYTFTGTFDGNNKYITYNMSISQDDLTNDYFGLFGFISGSGTVKNLTLKNCVIKNSTSSKLTGNTTSGTDIGVLAGAIYESSGGLTSVKIVNPTIECNIDTGYVGGIAGSIIGTDVKNCEVTDGGITSYCGPIGGMAGYGDISYFSGGKVSTTITKGNYASTDQIGKVVGNTEESSDVDVSGAIIETNSCIVAGPLITLADGTQVPVESLTGDETLLVWNLYTGSYDTASIVFIDKEDEKLCNVINLEFSDGTTVKVISEHGFWDCTLNKYVYLDKDASEYIGHTFLKQDNCVQLIGVTVEKEFISAYSPVTYSHLCYYVNGMLSMPGGIDGLFNLFEVNPETMSYDDEKMQDDICKYGLFTYEEFNAIIPVSQEMFEAFNGQYLKIAIGKGLTSEQNLRMLVERYAEYMPVD